MGNLFISDFDGTATALDFYKIVLNFIGEEGWAYVEDYRKTGKVDYHFLNKIFGWQVLSEPQYEKLIDTVKLDSHLRDLLNYLSETDTDFKFISAGFDRYILDVLEKEHYHDLCLITNPGYFEKGVLGMAPDTSSPFYSHIYGIDKGAVLRHYRKDYSKIYFAGDSEPDLSAALEADVIFAKGELISLVTSTGRSCIPFSHFEEVLEHLKRGV